MALAEPRRRTKWTLNPRGNFWSNDNDKFGKKLMEKMGWEKGKGLGANQNGMLEPVKIRQKDDSKGIGFEGHDDTWLEHQDDFQAVLAALNAEHGTETSQQSEKAEEETKQESLESTSKKSKKRVHYMKFTRGKDLANYSADDLGCILGTKSDKIKKKRKKERQEETEDTFESADLGSEEKSHGLVTIQGGNLNDYFAKKMAALKAQGKTTYAPPVTGKSDENSSEPEDSTSAQKVGFDMMSASESAHNTEDEALSSVKSTVETSEVIDTSEKALKKLRKKERKERRLLEEANSLVEPEEPPQNTETAADDSVVKKEKKKKKQRTEDLPAAAPQIQPVAQEKKKKKKRKRELSENALEVCDQSPETSGEEKVKKKKNKKVKKEKNLEEEEIVPAVLEDSGCEGDGGKTKKKKKGKKEKGLD